VADEVVAWVEAAGVAAHDNEAGSLLHRDDGLRVPQAVGEGDFDLDVLAGLEASQGLGGVHLGRRRQDHRVETREPESVGEIGRRVADTVLPGCPPRLLELAPDDGNDLDPVDQPDAVEMPEAKGAHAGQRDLDRFRHACSPNLYRGFSRMRWPTAVFDAGT